MKAWIEERLSKANLKAQSGTPFDLGYAQALADLLKDMDKNEAEMNRVKTERYCRCVRGENDV